MDDATHTNRLIHEKSPYLLQHAHNPVDWFPWGGEAFRRAEAEDKPVFLSIGYSTCHWCHVMARESFEDPQVAEALNRGYVCVKVDREERPDVDAVYMAVCQAFRGDGGWPLTILMTPGQKPFWAGTYLPKTSREGRTGLLELLETVSELWNADRRRLMETGEEVARLLQPAGGKTRPSRGPGKGALRGAYEWLRRAYDAEWGGFGPPPKFPVPCSLLFLLRYSEEEGEKAALEMAEHTLVRMYRGGIFDHIGGGFSRYSTDEKWLVPHFEKTLYDNALLSQAYLEAYRITRRPLYRRVAESTLRYVLRELTDRQSGFCCGQDADSDGTEGKFYAFTPDEIHTVLDYTRAEKFCNWFGVTKEGNFGGKSIPNLIANAGYEEENREMADACGVLYSYRRSRAALARDDKVLTGWNALMVAALADAWMTLGKPVYLDAARRAQRFLSTSLAGPSGRLLRRWRDGESGIDGQPDDYAFEAFALLRLYRATFQVGYLKEAAACAERMVDLFFDSGEGGFYLYAKDGERLISRPKEVYDGAMPSGNSVAAIVLVRLYKLTGETRWQELGRKQLAFLAGRADRAPAGCCAALLAFADSLYPSRELVCAVSGEGIPRELAAFLRERRRQLPFVLVKTQENRRELAEAAPFTGDYPIPSAGETYYLCRDGACGAPVSSLEELGRQLS